MREAPIYVPEQEDIIAAIEKAKDNGFVLSGPHKAIFGEIEIGYDRAVELWWKGKGYYGIIFSREFAKAFFGEESIKIKEGIYEEVEYEQPEWQIGLQQIVLEEDKAAYLNRFL